MISVTVLFLAFSGIVILGYILNALFAKIKIASILPLMLLGLIVGPLLHLINTSPGSLIQTLSPYITAIAIAFVLFDVGLSIDIRILEKVIFKISSFLFNLAVFTSILIGITIWLLLKWNLIISFIAGFALAGPSAIIVPSIVKLTKINEKLKAALVFESVATDSIQLIIPIILFSMIASGNMSLYSGIKMLFDFFILSPIFGILLAFFWVFMLRQFPQYSKEYSWMLTITMVIASYGMAQAIGLNGAVSTFVFGIFLINIPKLSKFLEKYTYDIRKEFIHIKDYQREITFFISTFFFFYIGLMFSIYQFSLWILFVALLLSLIIFYSRYLFVPKISEFFDKKHEDSEKTMATFNVARGLSPTIVATMPAALGINIPGFLDLLFITIIFTNIIMTIGMFFYAKKVYKK
jgi:NhaP-type Na+/H+ or K+/H+ antiporter